MIIRNCLLCAYRVLLALYPHSFRRRFAPEMLELAAAADISEWRLIFVDTSLGIVRCWLEGTHSTATLADANAYMPLRGSPIRASVFIPGLILSIAIVAGWSYANYQWPPPCPNGVHVVVRVANPSQLARGGGKSRPNQPSGERSVRP
ncbi:MAG: hypothetical protein ACRD3P_16085 [Terriglobales bacterium]